MAKKFKVDDCEWSDDMAIMVPRVGTNILLTENWEFRLHSEYRNSNAFELFGLNNGGVRNYRTTGKPRECNSSEEVPYGSYVMVSLLKGSVLKVDRVYIRKESKVNPDSYSLNQGGEYNSLTFRLMYASEDMILLDALAGTKRMLEGNKKPRFWTKLADVNRIRGKIDNASMATY